MELAACPYQICLYSSQINTLWNRAGAECNRLRGIAKPFNPLLLTHRPCTSFSLHFCAVFRTLLPHLSWPFYASFFPLFLSPQLSPDKYSLLVSYHSAPQWLKSGVTTNAVGTGMASQPCSNTAPYPNCSSQMKQPLFKVIQFQAISLLRTSLIVFLVVDLLFVTDPSIWCFPINECTLGFCAPSPLLRPWWQCALIPCRYDVMRLKYRTLTVTDA